MPPDLRQSSMSGLEGQKILAKDKIATYAAANNTKAVTALVAMLRYGDSVAAL